MIQPPHLVKGDTVAILCTARKFSAAEAQSAQILLEEWGLNVIFGKTIGADAHQLGGSDILRAADFNEMLRAPQVKAIWCARGGYGSVRIIDTIDMELLLRFPKWIIGFSDVTVFHNHVHQAGMQSIHGIMAFSVPKATQESKQTLKDLLFGTPVRYQLKETLLNKEGVAKGTLVGGNLSILYSLLGSKSALDTRGKILFIEDLDEYLYHIDRMLYNLKRNGCFEGLAGLIVGDFTDMHDNSIPFGMQAHELIRSICEPYNFPILFDFPAGHGVVNLALQMGAKIEMQVGLHEGTVQYIGDGISTSVR